MTRHRSGRALVERCDFITDMGHRTPGGTRAELGYTGGGPEWMVTALGVFDYDEDGQAPLRPGFPHGRVEQVRGATAVEMPVGPDLRALPRPTARGMAT